MVVFYSFQADLGDGWEDASVHNDPEETRTAALRMGANLITWASAAEVGRIQYDRTSYMRIVLQTPAGSPAVSRIRSVRGGACILCGVLLSDGFCGDGRSFAWFSPAVRTILAALSVRSLCRSRPRPSSASCAVKPDDAALARMVEKTFPGLGDRLISAVQLGRLDGPGLRGESPVSCVFSSTVSMERPHPSHRRTVSSRRLVLLGRTAYAMLGALLIAVALPGRSRGDCAGSPTTRAPMCVPA